MALRERPALLATLIERLTGQAAPSALSAVDSTLRFADVKETRPDLVLTAPELPWAILEVQHDVDDAKRRRWPLAAGVLLDEHKQMGDLLVLTARRRVARWAARAIEWQGRLGTRLSLRPQVLLVDLDAAERLLAEPEPGLALVAAWALGRRHGSRSQKLVLRAVERTASLAEPMRARQSRAILQLLGPRLLARLRTMLLKDLDKLPQSKAYKKFLRAVEGQAEARGKAEGKAEGLRTAVSDLCDLLGVELSPSRRAQLDAMSVGELEGLRQALKQARGWPSGR